MPDYFDRLLARYTPVGARDGVSTRVRPRLPGPFERVEALRYGPPDPGEPAALIPAAPVAAPAAAETVRHEREVRTDRHTMVRTAHVREADTPQAAAAAQERPPRPVAAVPPTVRPAAATAVPRAARRGRAADTTTDTPSRPAAAAPAPPAAPSPAVAAPAVPRGSDSSAARSAALGSVGRRAPKPAERVVHVQIGRLEVTAAAPPGADRRPAGPSRPGRAAPVLTLDDYLSRGGKRD
ncbi:hypothetical protein ABZ070_21205 [Streptomyces sp. NPDC006283]|uniref:hypothetical protein n=1 Tax=Streptomyces sp. NPDC006283 TaxID=3156741 RepID=UPI0033AF83FC